MIARMLLKIILSIIRKVTVQMEVGRKTIIKLLDATPTVIYNAVESGAVYPDVTALVNIIEALGRVTWLSTKTW